MTHYSEGEPLKTNTPGSNLTQETHEKPFLFEFDLSSAKKYFGTSSTQVVPPFSLARKLTCIHLCHRAIERQALVANIFSDDLEKILGK
jgi:hypothetical protein